MPIFNSAFFSHIAQWSRSFCEGFLCLCLWNKI